MTNQAQVDTFVATMKEVARYAEKYGVVVGLEDWISAQDNIKLLDAIGSDYVAVYYDAHNIVSRVPDIYVEPKLLGKRISQIHVKNANLLLETPGGKMDWPRMSKEYTTSAITAGTCSRPGRRRRTSSPTPAPTSHM